MKKIIISCILIIVSLAIFQSYKKDDSSKCPVTNNRNGVIKPITAVQCANITCHNAGTCEKELLTETSR